MLNPDLLTTKEKDHLHKLYVLWQNFKKITARLEDEKSWLEYAECHEGREVYFEEKSIIDNTLETLRPHTFNAWRRYSDEWNRLDKKYS